MRRVLMGPVVAGVIVGASAAPAGAMTAGDRGMWVWEGPDPAALAFASQQGVSDLYVHVRPGTASDPAVAELVADAHDQGVRVIALAGDPTWGAEHADHMVSWVREVRASGLFDGVQVDVEPYLLGSWKQDQDTAMRDFVRALRRARKAAGPLSLTAAVPFWFDAPEHENRKGRTLLERVVRATDGIAVMAYRDTAFGRTGTPDAPVDGIVDLARGEVEMAGRFGKTAVIGVQTRPDSLDKLSFAEEGRAQMEAVLATVDEVFGDLDGYGGTAVHDHRGWAGLAP